MEWFHTIIGHSSSSITWWQMSVRAVLLFGLAILLIRAGGNRIFGKQTVLDIVLGVVLGSNISRALTGNTPFIPAVVATAVLVAMHAGLAKLALAADSVSTAVKGNNRQLIDSGEILWPEMYRCGVGAGDLREKMRQLGHEPIIENIEDAFLERSGQISIIMGES